VSEDEEADLVVHADLCGTILAVLLRKSERPWARNRSQVCRCLTSMDIASLRISIATLQIER